jgi:hypothetical protein
LCEHNYSAECLLALAQPIVAVESVSFTHVEVHDAMSIE